MKKKDTNGRFVRTKAEQFKQDHLESTTMRETSWEELIKVEAVRWSDHIEVLVSTVEEKDLKERFTTIKDAKGVVTRKAFRAWSVNRVYFPITNENGDLLKVSSVPRSSVYGEDYFIHPINAAQT